MTLVLVRFFRYLIAVSIVISFSSQAVERKTIIGANLEALLGVPYDAFSGKAQTESGQSASCISVVAYGLRSLGYSCDYTGFRKYFDNMSQKAEAVLIGVTKFPSNGAIIFDHQHFTVTYSDRNTNNVIDGEDEIIHAPFGPVLVSTINEWLSNHSRQIFYVPIEANMPCPQSH